MPAADGVAVIVLGHVVLRYRHNGCCEPFKGRTVVVRETVTEEGTYWHVPPRCALTGIELWLDAFELPEQLTPGGS